MICKHPEVAKLATKELQYFNRSENFNKGSEWYINNFYTSDCTKAIGEFTPNYFWTFDENEDICKKNILADVPKLIYNFNPGLKLIVLLRNPVNRAISAYYHHIRRGRISPKAKFQDSKNMEGIISMGYYDIHFQNWLKYFPIENFLILFYEKELLDENKLNTLKKVYRHIGIDENFIPNTYLKKFNSQSTFFEIQIKYYFACFAKFVNLITPGFIRNHKLWKKKVNNFEIQTMIFLSKFAKLTCEVTPRFIQNSKYWTINVSNNDREFLKEIYKPHIIKLSEQLSQNLPW
jgi:hypothetical protein